MVSEHEASAALMQQCNKPVSDLQYIRAVLLTTLRLLFLGIVSTHNRVGYALTATDNLSNRFH